MGSAGCAARVVRLAVEDGGADAGAADAGAADVGGADGEVVRSVDASAGDPTGAGSVDLLMVIDNSSSMAHGQSRIQQLYAVMEYLVGQGIALDLHFAVVTSDLGTGGVEVPGCARSDGGDDGIMNPRARGPATRAHPSSLPWLDGSLCTDGVLLAPFETLSRRNDPMFLQAAPACHTGVGVAGCGLEQPLEAAYRALTVQSVAGGPNAGFLRRDAVLAVLVVSDEDDGSVRDCRYHDGVGSCDDARDVYRADSTRWSSPDLNLRLYDYAPGDAHDPTWTLDRYVDPARPTRGFLGLKPGHPERVVFGAITGVPLDVPLREDHSVDWDGLLGPPDPDHVDDFTRRDGQRAYADPFGPSGPTSMRQRDLDPQCPQRMVPACRLRDSAPTATCDAAAQPTAWRARRLAEVARRFDASPLCNGAPCRNGMVGSICEVHLGDRFSTFGELIRRRVVRRLP